MLVLGLNPGHDGAMAAVKDGKLLFSLEAEKNWFLSRGLIERDVPLSEAVDDSYVDYAVAALDRYQRQ